MNLASKLKMCNFYSTQAGIQFVGGYTGGYIGTTSNKVISLTSLTGGIATQPIEGDIVIVSNGGANYAPSYISTANLPSGYTNILNSAVSISFQYGYSSRISYKIMSSTPDTLLTIPGGTGNASCAGSVSILVFRGVNQTTPLDVTPISSASSSTAKPNPPSITPATTGAIIVCGGVAGHTQATGTFTSSDLTNFISSAGDDTYDCTTGVGYKEWSSGAFDAAQFGFTRTDNSSFYSVACSVALRPA